MHTWDAATAVLAQAVVAYAQERLSLDEVPLDGTATVEQLELAAGSTITPGGLGGPAALALFRDTLALACLSTDHPRYLSFIPCAPTDASALFDLVVGASSIYAGSWLEGSGAVFAENAALRWIADLAGMPPQAGGVFVPGGTVGNLSALVTARETARARYAEQLASRGEGTAGPGRAAYRVAAQAEAHSSIPQMCRVMDAELVGVPGDARFRLTGDNLRRVVEEHGPETFFAVVATAGTTNFGLVDDLAGVAAVCQEHRIWLHVDGAYGGAALAAPSVRHLFRGVELADSFIVDPHKWLFAPFDCCALIYRQPALARAAHTQHASYLDVLTEAPDWNPTDYAVGLTRRARGLPFWFSLAAHGTRAYTEAIEQTLTVARFAVEEVRRRAYLELVRPADLSVVVFRRVGWTAADYHRWSERLRLQQYAFVVPTSYAGETLARFAIVNPRTSEEDIAAILDTMA